jgi:hypothetical protein
MPKEDLASALYLLASHEDMGKVLVVGQEALEVEVPKVSTYDYTGDGFSMVVNGKSFKITIEEA